MNKFFRIYSTDSKPLRRSKKSFKQKLKSKQKRKYLRLGIPKKRRKKQKARRSWEYSPKAVKYSKEIQSFLEANQNRNQFYNSGEIDLDSDFSLFDNPQKVLSSLLYILYEAKTNKEFVVLNYKEKLSFGALYFIDTICWQIATSKRWELRCNFPAREQTILMNLKSIITNTSDSKYAYIINNKIKINRQRDDLAKQTHREKSKEIRDLINKGLKEEDPDYDLSLYEQAAIDSAISEHFDNILLHVPEAEYGYLCGYFDKEKKEVTVLIYNFGHTIARTLDKKGLPNHVQTAVDEVIRNHTKNSIIWGNSYSKENALTLLAVQEGISSKLDADKSRGHGIIDFIEHCKDLNSNSKIVIISGRTSIKIDSDYQIENKPVFGRNRRVLALNKDNDIFDKPNPNKVVNLGINFPGVIIETTIPLKATIRNGTN